MAAKPRPHFGVYHPSLILTYLGVTASVVGICLAITGQPRAAIICLIIAAVCDTFDGTIARRFERTPEEQLFGIQADSLADLVGFCVLPVVLFSSLGYLQWYHVAGYVLLTLAGITRLGWFNVQAARADEAAPVENFTGVPSIATALITPLLWLLLRPIGPSAFSAVLTATLVLVSVGFVANIQIKKPSTAWRVGIAVFAAALIYVIWRVAP